MVIIVASHESVGSGLMSWIYKGRHQETGAQRMASVRTLALLSYAWLNLVCFHKRLGGVGS